MNDYGLNYEFKEHIDYEINSNGCWICLRVIGDSGYGCKRYLNSKGQWATMTIHRYTHCQKYNINPDVYLDADHLCRIRRCMNPDHVEMKTKAANVMCGDGITAQNARLTACRTCGGPLKLRHRRCRPDTRYCPKCQYKKQLARI